MNAQHDLAETPFAQLLYDVILLEEGLLIEFLSLGKKIFIIQEKKFINSILQKPLPPTPRKPFEIYE
jgi:hypothetical protein